MKITKFARHLLFIFIFAVITTPAFSQDSYAEKVSSLDNILETLYGVISGEAGEKRDWDLFQFIFTENARLIPIRKQQDGNVKPNFLSPADYVERAGSFLEENGFFEKEIHRVTESFGHLTHVFSTYESYRTASDNEPFDRGINSIQVMHDGERYWVVNISWVSESEGFDIPSKYLP
jgi:hypothetical protein